MDDQKYVYLLLVDTKYDDFVVQCPTSTNVQVGDLVEIGIQDATLYGTVTKLTCTNINSDEYFIINTMCDMSDKLLHVYRQVWEGKCNEDNEDSDGNQATGIQASSTSDGGQAGIC